MNQSDFPVSPAELGAQQLTAYLRASGVLSSEVAVQAIESTLIGHGKMGTNARLTLSYTGSAPGAPRSVVGKFPAEDPRAREIAGVQGAYYKEVMFYRELAPRTEMKTPAIYASEVSEDGKDFLLLMEDLVDAQPGNNLEGATEKQATQAAREAAILAASFYGDESIADRDFVLTTARTDGGALGQAFLEQCWPGFVDRFGHGLPEESLAFGEYYVGHHGDFVTRYDGPTTLVHGDFRAENILFGDQRATTVDWQTASESSPLADLAYFMGGSVDTVDRRASEQGMVGYFREVLAEQGVELSAQDCWNQYREYSMHGLMIVILGASFSSPDPRGDDMFLLMIRRHLQHCLDMGAREFIE